MLIYRRAHVASCARHFGAVLPIVAGVSALVFFSRILADAEGGVSVSSAAQLLGLTLLRYAPQLLAVSLAAAVTLAMARAFKEMEMDAWFALGAGMRHFVYPTFVAAAPVVVLIAALSAEGSPWAARAGEDIRAELGRAIAPENLRSGVFGRALGGRMAYFIEDDDEGNIRRVFLARRLDAPEGSGGSGGKGGLHEVALSGGLSRGDGGQAKLESGRLYRLLPNSDAPADRMAFDELEVTPPPPERGERRARFRAWENLSWSAADERAEMVWRINMPLAALTLALLALALSRSHPKMGRGHGFVSALLLFSVNLNLLYFARDSVADEVVSGWVGVVAPHCITVAIGLTLVWIGALRR